ncbi:hypothetical protein FO440_11505 [Mucilaginibacter corticis]|uniref:Uncharacterized protein n=1 Tax=Mucilaginibacter corticis TaxID=2597670 RepID=A0A556MKE0_9SPHI|nr:hypothetical protein [Mucilaginibacter corticis]TSJ40378.1 hypothetical protein FO440_11505 [Mucilaginibacter corticis]
MRYLHILLLILIVNAAHGAGLTRYEYTGRSVYNMAKDTDTIIRKQSLSVGINYGSDAMFFGRTGPITYPFFSTDVVYNTKAGFFIYGSALRLIGYRTSVDEVDVGGGYLYRPSKKFSGSISYNRFIFNKEERIIESATSNDVNWKNSMDWKPFKSTVILDYLFGKSSDFFLTLTQSKYFETKGNIFSDDDYLSFNPGISAIIGTQNFVQRYSLDHQDRFDADNIYKYGPGAPSNFNNGRLNMLNYSFKLPIAYNRPHYTFEFSYKYSIPVNVEGALENKHESFFNASFFYIFY